MLEKVIVIFMMIILLISSVPTIEQIDSNFEGIIEQNISQEDLENAQRIVNEQGLTDANFTDLLQALINNQYNEHILKDIDSVLGVEGWGDSGDSE